MILVSHDRYFLDKVTTRILELYEGTTVDYPGNFSKYWELKEERNKVLERTFEKQKEFIAKTEDFIRRNHYGQKATQAKDREKKLERLERVDRPREIPLPVMGFGQPRRAGDWVFDLEGVTKGFGGEPLFRDVTLRVPRGERVGIFGPNGAGKKRRCCAQSSGNWSRTRAKCGAAPMSTSRTTISNWRRSRTMSI